MLAQAEAGDDEIGRMLRDLTAPLMPALGKPPTQRDASPRPAAPEASSAGLAATGSALSTLAGQFVAPAESALDSAGILDEIQRTVGYAMGQATCGADPAGLQQAAIEEASAAKAEAARLRETCEVLAGEEEDMQARIATLQAAAAEAAARALNVDAVRDAAAAAEAAAADLQARLAALEKENAQLAQVRAGLEGDLAVARSLGPQLEALKAASATAAAAREDDVAAALAATAEACRERDALRATAAPLRKRLQAAEAELAQLKAACASDEAEAGLVNNLRTGLESTTARCDELVRQLAAALAELGVLRAERSAINAAPAQPNAAHASIGVATTPRGQLHSVATRSDTGSGLTTRVLGDEVGQAGVKGEAPMAQGQTAGAGVAELQSQKFACH
jgi:hypothetical protein